MAATSSSRVRSPATTTTSGPVEVDVGGVRARVRVLLGSLSTAEAEIVVHHLPVPESPVEAPPEGRFRWARTAQGDHRMGNRYYDATRGVLRQISENRGRPTLMEDTGLAPGPPDSLATGPRSYEDPELMVRAILELDGATATATVHDGRPVWVVQAVLTPWSRFAGLDHAMVTIDQATGLAVAIVFTDKGRPVRDVRVEQLAVNRPFPPEEFSPAPPPGAAVTPGGTGPAFTRMSLQAAAREGGFSAPLPARVPDGFARAEVAFGGRVLAPGAGVTHAISMAYRRGLHSFVVTARPQGSDPSLVSRERLFGLTGGPRTVLEATRAEPVVLQGGRFDGAVAQINLDPFRRPHLWVAADGLVVTIAGDMSRAELVDVAQSLG